MSDFDNAKRDASDLAKLVNEDTDVTTRYGENPKVSAPKAIRQITEKGNDAIRSYNITPAFDFADGFTIETRNQAGKDANGDYWIYNGALPFTVTAGAVPSEPDYTNVVFSVITDSSIWGDRYVGTFASGFTYNSYTDVARGQDGKYYSYIGNDVYPVTVAAGTVASDFNGLYSEVDYYSYIDQLGDEIASAPSGNLFNDAFNFESSKTDAALLKNIAGSNQDTWVMLFGDSHAWGQGAPQQDRFQLSSNYSSWSAAPENLGFMARVKRYIEDNKQWVTNKFGAGMTETQNYLHAGNNEKNWTGDPERSFPLVCLGGNVTSLKGGYSETDNTPVEWYAPQLRGDSYSNLSYREKVSAGIFGTNYMRLERCTRYDMPTNGKEHYWEITADYSSVSYGAGFTDITYDNGGGVTPLVMGAVNSANNFVTINSGSPVPDWVYAGAEVYISGWGYGRVKSVGSVNRGVTLEFLDGSAPGGTLAKQVHLGMKIYPAIYAYGLLQIDMASPARVSYVAVKRSPNSGKIRLAFTSNMNGGFQSFPYVDNNSTFRNSANPWSWKLASGVPLTHKFNKDGSLTGAAEIVSDAFGVIIDTKHTEVEDVVYRIDWGSRMQGRMFILLDQTTTETYVDIRGVVFDNNRVSNYAMGAHTVGAWIGTQDTTSAQGVRDRVADILRYTPVRPSYVITQVPFVNEYLMQTPIADFKSNLEIFVNKFVNHKSSSNNYNTPATNFMFFTSLRNKDVFNGGSQSAITYDMYVQAVNEFCTENNHAFVDCEKELVRLVQSGRVDSDRLFNDSNHPSDYSNEVIFDALKQDYLSLMV